MRKKVIISSASELVCFPPEHAVFAESDGNYTTVTLIDGTKLTFSFNLLRFSQILVEQLKSDASAFIRIGKSLIINREYVLRINPTRQSIVLATPMMSKTFSLQASREALRQVKHLLECELPDSEKQIET